MLNPDYKEMLSELLDEGVEFLVVGAMALAAFGHVRATGDIDIWVRPSGENAVRVIAVLKRFGAPLHDLGTQDLTTPGTIFQIGVAPRRIDFVTSIDGVEFEEAWAGKSTWRVDGLDLPVLSRDHVIANKKAVGRHKDLADVEALEAILRRSLNDRG